jgi:hypothetical protein
MKWIGQNVYDFISRFRNDVYLDSPTAGGSDPDKFLGIDTNNKIVYRTGAEVKSDIGAGSGDGTITQIRISADDSNTFNVTSGSANFNIFGGTGIDTTVSGTTITITPTTASASASGIVELATTAEVTNGTDTGRAVTPDGLQDGYQGSTNVTTLGTIATGTWESETVIASAYLDADTAHLSGTQTFTGAKTFTDTVALTGTGRITGVDTVTADEDAANKAYVDGKYSYVYMTWSASAVSTVDGSDPEWVFPNAQKGVYEEDWNKDENIKATSTGTTTYTVGRQSAINALVIPHTGICVGFHAHGRNDDNDASFRAGLFHLEGSTTGTTNNGGIDYGNTASTHEATLRWIATADEAEASGGADGTSGHSFKGPCKLVSNTTAVNVSAGDALLPAIMGPDASDEIFVTMTIILKIPLA